MTGRAGRPGATSSIYSLIHFSDARPTEAPVEVLGPTDYDACVARAGAEAGSALEWEAFGGEGEVAAVAEAGGETYQILRRAPR